MSTTPTRPAQQAASPRVARTESVTGFVALVVFLGLPMYAWLAPRLAGRAIWTVVVALLPLAITLGGYYWWRRICPLAWLSQLPARVGRPGQRKTPRWLQSNYYAVTLAILAFCLWLRLIGINGDGRALAIFLVALSVAAMAFGSVFTGKVWCNYVCPVSLVEKIYTEPRSLKPAANSQCAKCSACKPACPDIDEENGYWKEMQAAPKRAAYFAFPGLVAGFYLFYWLQSGTWAYYFGGYWTHEPGLIWTAFTGGTQAAGFFFLPAVPRAAAAAITLLVSMGASYLLFGKAEQWLQRRAASASKRWMFFRWMQDEATTRHLVFSVAAFTAFISFYTFAGAPTLRLVPGLPHVFLILVVATATLALARRITRRQRAYSEEALARQIIRRWPWEDVPPPDDLREAYLIHTVRAQTRASGHAQLIAIYKDAVREVVASGLVSRAEVQRLESLRGQLQINATDHERVMNELDEEQRALINDTSLQVSPEKRLQLETYAQALARYVEGAGEGPSDDSFVRQLRAEYGVSAEEHAAVLDYVFATRANSAARLAEALAAMEQAAAVERLLGSEARGSAGLLVHLVARRRARAVDTLFATLGCPPGVVRDALLHGDDAARDAAIRSLAKRIPPSLSERLLMAYAQASVQVYQAEEIRGLLEGLLSGGDAYTRATALYVLAEGGGASAETIARLVEDDHPLVRETAMSLERQPNRRLIASSELTLLEKIFALRAAPIFASLPPEELAAVAGASVGRDFRPGESLCEEGESGDDVYLLLSGDVNVMKGKGGEQRRVAVVESGGVIGELAALDPAPRAATVVAGDQGARTLCVLGDVFREVLMASPPLAREVMRVLAQRVRTTETPAARAAAADPPRQMNATRN